MAYTDVTQVPLLHPFVYLKNDNDVQRLVPNMILTDPNADITNVVGVGTLKDR